MKVAQAFGARPIVEGAAVSPDGSKIVLIQPGEGTMDIATVVDVATGDVKPFTYADGKPMRLVDCGWSAANRVVCELGAIATVGGTRMNWTRLVGVDADGSHQISLGRSVDNTRALRINQFQGRVIDWMTGEDGSVLMERQAIPEESTGSLIAHDASGLGVERVDTRTNRAQLIEPFNDNAISYMSDGKGTMRIMELVLRHSGEQLTGGRVFKYRTSGSRSWQDFSRIDKSGGSGLVPLAVDSAANAAYALDKKDGRDALFRVALDGSMKADLVYADSQVDVDSVITIGRRGRAIGFSYTTDQPIVKYFDPDYERLAGQLSKAIPTLPQIEFISTSADEQTVLLRAASQQDPGKFFLLNRKTHSMSEVMPARPGLVGMTFGEVKAISYPAADGTMIPAYLTLPPHSDGKRIPALVMPHGGPEARDYGGFDYLAQFFAQRGFAVIQPEYRGSTGYGEAFFNHNGFQSWKTAIGDVNDAGRWLVRQGIAEPSKLAIFGWSYGGYAALQSNVLDPKLFKAVVAVAPVTDFDMLVEEERSFTDYDMARARMGNGAYSQEGSPARHAGVFEAPVLMFHGDQDMNVGIGESRAMDSALRRAGKLSRLVVYPGLDHYLKDSKARTDMLAQSDTFLRTALNMQPQ